MDRPRKQILNRSVNCFIVGRKENKVAVRKLDTIVFALFSVAVAVSTHLCLSPFLLPHVAVLRPFRFSVEI